MKKKEIPTESVQNTIAPEVTQNSHPELERLEDADNAVLEMIKLKRSLALANAEKALAQNESAELNYRMVVMQLSIKYNLKAGDVINDDGSFKRK